ncbi:MAG: AMP-binding protein, partial [Actinomycetota bacterium]|nr:AMP-binding protein [Actinomycetota bacterium]
MLPTLVTPDERDAVRFGADVLTHAQLAGAARAVAAKLRDARRVAVWATPSLPTVVAVVGGLVAGTAVVPVNPKIGERELDHIVRDSAPDVVLAEAGTKLPPALAALPRIAVDPGERLDGELPAETDPEAPAFIVYTSGTTGPPKGVLLPRRSITSNLDALADAWEWTSADVVVHALPLFHVHGLILGVLGPLRRGGAVHHIGRFDSAVIASALSGAATMMFGVPTMYHRLATDCEADADLATAIGTARLLVSGSAALPARDHARITKTTGQHVVERYGMTETLMNCAVRASADRRPGTVGPPVDGVELRLVDDAGEALTDFDGETVG